MMEQSQVACSSTCEVTFPVLEGERTPSIERIAKAAALGTGATEPIVKIDPDVAVLKLMGK